MFSIGWSKKKCSFMGSSSCKGSDDEGLRLILRKIANGNSNNVVVKPILLPNQTPHQLSSAYCYLKSCHLCHKPLSLDTEIYMYRGDLGFCSVECRDRQIYLDETKEIEISTQKILSSFRHRSRRDGRCETSQLLDDFRRRRHPFSPNKNPIIFL